MTAIHELSQPRDVTTPRGRGTAIMVIDYGADHHLCWVVNMRDTGECWTFRNPDIRFEWCETTGTGTRPAPEKNAGPGECHAAERHATQDAGVFDRNHPNWKLLYEAPAGDPQRCDGLSQFNGEDNRLK